MKKYIINIHVILLSSSHGQVQYIYMVISGYLGFSTIKKKLDSQLLQKW